MGRERGKGGAGVKGKRKRKKNGGASGRWRGTASTTPLERAADPMSDQGREKRGARGTLCGNRSDRFD